MCVQYTNSGVRGYFEMNRTADQKRSPCFEDDQANVADLVNSIENFIKELESNSFDSARHKTYNASEVQNSHRCPIKCQKDEDIKPFSSRFDLKPNFQNGPRIPPEDNSTGNLMPSIWTDAKSSRYSDIPIDLLQSRVSTSLNPLFLSDDKQHGKTDDIQDDDEFARSNETPLKSLAMHMTNMSDIKELIKLKKMGDDIDKGASTNQRFKEHNRVSSALKGYDNSLLAAESTSSEVNRAGTNLVSSTTNRVVNQSCFPHILYTLLDDAKEGGFDDIVSWQEHGRAFRVHDPVRFVDSIMSNYFHQTRYASFQRQIAIYGFIRISRRGKDHGAYYHARFLKGHPDLCQSIQRTPVKRNWERQFKPPKCVPDFYEMTPLSLSGKICLTYETERRKMVSEEDSHIPSCEASALRRFSGSITDSGPLETGLTISQNFEKDSQYFSSHQQNLAMSPYDIVEKNRRPSFSVHPNHFSYYNQNYRQLSCLSDDMQKSQNQRMSFDPADFNLKQVTRWTSSRYGIETNSVQHDECDWEQQPTQPESNQFHLSLQAIENVPKERCHGNDLNEAIDGSDFKNKFFDNLFG
jgi:HSF-type DNA-binding